MVRPVWPFLLLLGACTGQIESKLTEGLPPEQIVALDAWSKKALPIFTKERTGGACVSCHDGSRPAAPAYLAGDDDIVRRETLINFMPRIINLLSPRSSRMLSVGDHTAMMGGTALDAPELDQAVDWIQAEAAARPAVEPIRTAPFTPMLCTSGNPGDATCPINTVDLSAVGPTPVAAQLTFVIQNVSGDSYFTQLKIKAGADGVYLEHPQIESYPGGAVDPTPDPLDLLFAVTLNIQPSMEAPVGSGTESIHGFAPTDPISIRFDVIEKVRPGT